MVAPRAMRSNFFEHALSLNVLTEAVLDGIADDVGNGRQTEESAISAYLERTRDAVWPFYKSVTWETPTDALRFAVGDQVQANQGGEWAPATVVALWHRESDWDCASVAPYQMKLDHGGAFPVGAAVVIEGLVTHSAHNGRHGCIISALNATTGRCGVELDGDEKRLSLKPINVRRLIYAPVDATNFVIAAGEDPPPSRKIDKAMLLGYGSKSTREEWEEGGYGPLHSCCMMRGDIRSLRQLLRRPLPQCNPNNCHNSFRESPLCMAACYGQLHCAILLLAAGADPRVPNCWGETPAKIAKTRGSLGPGGKWAGEALVALLERRAAELDAEEDADVEAEDRSTHDAD